MERKNGGEMKLRAKRLTAIEVNSTPQTQRNGQTIELNLDDFEVVDEVLAIARNGDWHRIPKVKPESKEIEKLSEETYEPGDLMKKVNELVDAINSMRKDDE